MGATSTTLNRPRFTRTERLDLHMPEAAPALVILSLYPPGECADAACDLRDRIVHDPAALALFQRQAPTLRPLYDRIEAQEVFAVDGLTDWWIDLLGQGVTSDLLVAIYRLLAAMRQYRPECNRALRVGLREVRALLPRPPGYRTPREWRERCRPDPEKRKRMMDYFPGWEQRILDRQ
jgi:hypothetical protein